MTESPNHRSNHFDLAQAVLTGNQPAAERLLDAQQVDGPELLAWLKRHHLGGQFATAVDESELASRFPPAVLEALQRRLERQRKHNHRVLAATGSAIDILRNGGLSVIVLKGVHYAERFYGDLGERFLWDVDLMVRPTEREAALRCLLAAGYRLKAEGPSNNRITRGLTHAVALLSDDLELDLHWQLRNRPAYRIDYERLWNTRQSFRIGEHDFEVPSDDYTLLTQLLNTGNDLEAGRFKLKHLVDLDRMLALLDSRLDWDRFFRERQGERVDRLVLSLLAMYRAVFDNDAQRSNLTAAIADRQGSVPELDREAFLRLAQGRRQSLRNRWWAASVYPDGRLAYFSWWTLTAPLRFAIGRTV